MENFLASNETDFTSQTADTRDKSSSPGQIAQMCKEPHISGSMRTQRPPLLLNDLGQQNSLSKSTRPVAVF